MRQEPLMLEKQSILRERTLTFLDVLICSTGKKKKPVTTYYPIREESRDTERLLVLLERGDFD